MIHHQIEVLLKDRSYPIYVGSAMVSSFAATCEKHEIAKDVTIISDRNVSRHYLKPLEKNLAHFGYRVSPIVIPSGESQKNLNRANAVFTAMLKSGIGRRSGVIALGGGVVGDLAGFIAATYHRGVPLVQVPTTLLSQVDSSIGGKTAVNHPLGKNMIGAFYQPKFVWTDIDCLRTLPFREVACGMGEIIKYGVIADADLFAYLEEHIGDVLRLQSAEILHVQERCSSIKARLVSEDERENGIRVILNFGHTIGHALEAAGDYRLVKHGEAVLFGMVAESFIARELGMISQDVYKRIERLIESVPVKVNLKSLSVLRIEQATARDKKGVKGKNRFVLPTRIGEVKVVEAIEPPLVRKAIGIITGNRQS